MLKTQSAFKDFGNWSNEPSLKKNSNNKEDKYGGDSNYNLPSKKNIYLNQQDPFESQKHELYESDFAYGIDPYENSNPFETHEDYQKAGEMEMIVEESKEDYESKNSHSRVFENRFNSKTGKSIKDYTKRTEDVPNEEISHLKFEDLNDLDKSSGGKFKDQFGFDELGNSGKLISQSLKAPNFGFFQNKQLTKSNSLSVVDQNPKQAILKKDTSITQSAQFNENQFKLTPKSVGSNLIQKAPFSTINENELWTEENDPEFTKDAQFGFNQTKAMSKQSIFRKEKSLKIPISVENGLHNPIRRSPTERTPETDQFYTPNKTEKDVLNNFNNNGITLESQKEFSPSNQSRLFNFKKHNENGSVGNLKDCQTKNSDVDKLTPNSNYNFNFIEKNPRNSEKSVGKNHDESKPKRNRNVSEIKRNPSNSCNIESHNLI